MGAQPDTLTSTREVWHGVPQILAQVSVAAHLATYLVVHPLNQCDFWRCCDTEATWAAMTPAAAPDKGVLVGVPVIGGTLHGLLDLGPCIEATPLQRKGAQPLPPRLHQVQIGRID